jgi:hypothetical protein
VFFFVVARRHVGRTKVCLGAVGEQGRTSNQGREAVAGQLGRAQMYVGRCSGQVGRTKMCLGRGAGQGGRTKKCLGRETKPGERVKMC